MGKHPSRGEARLRVDKVIVVVVVVAVVVAVVVVVVRALALWSSVVVC